MFDATATAIRWVEQGVVPDGVTRSGIRALLRQRLATLPTRTARRPPMPSAISSP